MEEITLLKDKNKSKMWTCPICGTTNEHIILCSVCQFDRRKDFRQYPFVSEKISIVEEYYKLFWDFRKHSEEFEIQGNTLIKYKGNKSHVIIPNGIIKVADFAFEECKLESVVIPDSVDRIGICAFRNCLLLKSVSFSKKLQKIEPYAFSNCCSLEKIELPLELKEIELGVFSKCFNLKSVKFPEGLSAIDSYSFERCEKLHELNLPDGIQSIESYAFADCVRLSFVKMPEKVRCLSSGIFEGCINLNEVIMGSNVQKIEAAAFKGCSNLKKVKWSENLQEIKKRAFMGTGITAISFPDHLERVGTEAFLECKNLVSIEFSRALVSIGPSAFQNCSNLERIKLPAWVNAIGPFAFCGCESLAKIVGWAWDKENKVNKLEIPCHIKLLGWSAFPWDLFKKIDFVERTEFDGIEVLDNEGCPFCQTKLTILGKCPRCGSRKDRFKTDYNKNVEQRKHYFGANILWIEDTDYYSDEEMDMVGFERGR